MAGPLADVSLDLPNLKRQARAPNRRLPKTPAPATQHSRLLRSAILTSHCLFVILAFALFGCDNGSAYTDDGVLTVGFVYVGPRDDYGYNQAHAAGAAAVQGIPGVKVVEEERVPDTADVQKTMRSMIELDGARVIFPTSFNYFDPHTLAVAADHPDVTFVHCGGLWDAQKHPTHVSSYFGYIDECEYLSGMVAAYATKSKKLGFVAGKPIPQVRRNVNAFTLGARSVDPSIRCCVIFTGDWSLPVKEAEAATSLINQGVDVMTCHVNSPKSLSRPPSGAASTLAATIAARQRWRPTATSPAPNGAGRGFIPIS
jgi:basic membrane lipoprotein Med (substrate-binding protein (PBP1-ABC) superfamily)